MTKVYHYICEFYGCGKETLSKAETIKAILTEAASRAGMHLIDSKFHQFKPAGVTGFILLKESHISIHTWPEYDYAAVDVFTCGDEKSAVIAMESITLHMDPKEISVKTVPRMENIKRETYFHFGHAVRNLVYSKKTKYQKLDIGTHPVFGKVLFLDNIPQVSVHDEPIYSQALVGMGMDRSMKNVCIMGGGDCGVLREVLKDQGVEKAVMVEIDKEVVNASKKYLPEIVGNSFSDKRAQVVIGDAFEYVKNNGKFDLVIYDLTDFPVNMQSYDNVFSLIKDSLAEKGRVAVQCCSTIERQKLGIIMKSLKSHFSDVKTREVYIPSFYLTWVFAGGRKK